MMCLILQYQFCHSLGGGKTSEDERSSQNDETIVLCNHIRRYKGEVMYWLVSQT